jgi:hypothetical protein
MDHASEQRPREPISTRIERDALEVIAKVAAERRTTTSQVARVLLEDGARQLAAGV